ncbi:MAG: methyltransferase [Myxococcota bacterium]
MWATWYRAWARWVERAQDGWSRTWTRTLGSPRFQAWAARFPLFRPIARSRAQALFDLSAGFVYSQILLAGVRLRLFEALRSGPKRIRPLAQELGLEVQAAQRLADASVALRLLERLGPGRYGLGIHGAALLGQPGAIRMIEHHGMLYRDLEDPVRLLRDPQADTELRRYWSYAKNVEPEKLGPDDVGPYSDLMASTSAMLAQAVLQSYSFRRHHHLLDVGGGDGVFVSEVARAQVGLRAMCLDLPSVATRAAERFRELRLSPRVQAVGGNMFTDPLPRGADVVTLVRILHDLEDRDALRLLRRIHDALPRHGRLLVIEPMAETRGAERTGFSYFGFYLMAMGQGRSRTARELREMAKAAGFRRISYRNPPQPTITQLLVCTPGHFLESPSVSVA